MVRMHTSKRKEYRVRQIGLTMVLFCVTGSLLSQDQGGARAGKFSGYMFGDYYYNLQRDANLASQTNVATPGTTAMQGFQFRRIYLTYDNDIAEQFTSRFRLEADQIATTSNGKIGVFVKDAYLRWKNIFSGSDLIFGIQPPPTYDVSDAVWGYRSLEKTIMDLRGIYASRDIGVSLKGRLVESGTLNYWLMIGKNAGNNPAASKYNRYSAHLHVKPSANLQATIYADYNDRARKNDPFTAGTNVVNGTTTFALFVAYTQSSHFSLGAEGFTSSTANGYTSPGARSLSSLTATGFSAWASVSMMSDVAAVARFDYFDPNSAANAGGDARNYVIGGISWKPNKNISIIPNILYETYEEPSNGTRMEASTTARITLYYIFL